MRVRQHTADKFARGVAFFALRDGQEDPDRQPHGPHRRHRLRRRAACTRWTPGSALIGYAFQIYFDFSGYSDMAVGLALMMGFVLIQNFDSPYKADSITDFWRRWHISLSTWLRDYLYIPLGGNRHGAGAHLRQPDDGDAAGRAVARGQLELRHLGRHPRRHAGGRARPGQSTAPTAGCPARCGWASPSSWSACPGCSSGPRRCRRRWSYLRSLFGLAEPAYAANAVAGSLYTPYHAGMLGLAAVVVWGMPNTWAFTARISLAPGGGRRWRCWRCRS